MRITTLICCLILVITFQSKAQFPGVPPSGPISLALGGVSSPFQNEYAIFNNPGGILTSGELNAFAAYQTILNFSPFNTVSAGVNIPTTFGGAAFGVYRFGDDIFNSQMASLGISRKIGIMSLGIKTSILQYNIENFGSRSVFVAEMGGIAQLSEILNFGIHIYNFTQSVIAEESGEKLPTILRLSAAIKASEKFDLYVEGEKDVDESPDLKFGVSYLLNDMIFIRTGFSTLTNRHSLGAGITLTKFKIDYALRANRNIGSAHNLGIIYTFK